MAIHSWSTLAPPCNHTVPIPPALIYTIRDANSDIMLRPPPLYGATFWTSHLFEKLYLVNFQWEALLILKPLLSNAT